MPARQYEKADCNEQAVLGVQYEVAEASIVANGGGEMDIVIVFGNPVTRRIVWVPYGSEIKIDEKEFIVKRGNLRSYQGDRLFTHDQSLDCLVEKDKKTYSLFDFRGKKTQVSVLNNSFLSALEQSLFDWYHYKLEPVDTSSFNQLERYGVLREWRSRFRNSPFGGLNQLARRVEKLERKL